LTQTKMGNPRPLNLSLASPETILACPSHYLRHNPRANCPITHGLFTHHSPLLTPHCLF